MTSKLAEVNHPVACPLQWLPVLLATASTSDSQLPLEPYLPNPGCAAHYNTSSAGQYNYSVQAQWAPIELQFNGSKFGYDIDAEVNSTTSCDQMAALGLNIAKQELEIRGVSSLVPGGYHLGWLGAEGEEIEFRYWNGQEEKEYFVHERFTMGGWGSVENFQGSFGQTGPKVLELAAIPPCGCQIGCKKYTNQFGTTDLNSNDECVEDNGMSVSYTHLRAHET